MSSSPVSKAAKHNKRPGSPISANVTPRKKRNNGDDTGDIEELEAQNISHSEQLLAHEIAEDIKVPVFKDPNFVHSVKGAAGAKKTRIWKTLKQIMSDEKKLNWPPDSVCYSSIDAPPSMKPAKKYSDITGLEALYTDPVTKLYYANPDEYVRVKMLPQDIVAGLLQLRKATSLVS